MFVTTLALIFRSIPVEAGLDQVFSVRPGYEESPVRLVEGLQEGQRAAYGTTKIIFISRVLEC